MTDGLSAGDALALTRDRDDDGYMMAWMNNPFIYFVWMMFMRWFNNGDGGNALTQAELFDGLGRQDILGNQREIQQTLCGINGAMQTGFGNIRYDNLQNVMGLQSAMTSGFYGVNSGLAENRFAQQQCCCETNRSIDAVRSDLCPIKHLALFCVARASVLTDANCFSFIKRAHLTIPCLNFQLCTFLAVITTTPFDTTILAPSTNWRDFIGDVIRVEQIYKYTL